MRSIARVLWLTLGSVSLALGVLGAFLPLLPTTPFLLLTAFCYARSSEQLHGWLMDHPRLGPPIAHWRDHRAISTRAKVIATAAMGAMLMLSLIASVPNTVLLGQAIVLTLVLLLIWTRPTPPAATLSADPCPEQLR